VTTELGRDVQKAAALLERGLLVAIPTETVYGLAANAYDAEAVAQIFEAKNRPKFDPLIVHTASLDQAREQVSAIPDWASSLARRFWPGPLTLVLPKRELIPDIVTAGLPNVAVRVPAHDVALDLLARLDFPLAAPSANPFGYVSPTRAEHVMAQLEGKISYVLDGGECSVGVESTIVAEKEGKLRILRLGGVSVEEIEELVGPVETILHSTSNPEAPGQLETHYAPKTPVILGAIDPSLQTSEKQALVSFQTRYANVPPELQVVLSPEGNLREAAKNLFAALRYVDTLDVDRILIEPVPDVGIGRAINDRLRRAATPSPDRPFGTICPPPSGKK
jgi:L-threonylcarbamoyladenylate synthase